MSTDANEAHEPLNQDRIRPRHLRRLGMLILVAGLIAAATAYFQAAPDDGAERLFQAGTLLSGNARRYANEMKDLGGQANVLAAEARDWFSRQWHGRRLARTLLVLSGSGAVACFLAAHLMNFVPPANPGDGPAPAQARFPARPPKALPKKE